MIINITINNIILSIMYLYTHTHTYIMKTLFAKTDNSIFKIFKNHVFYYVIMFLLC